MSKNGHQSKSLLHITLFPDKGSSDSTGFGNATASALIHRSEVDHLIKSDEMFDDGKTPVLKYGRKRCLVNLMYASPDSDTGKLSRFMLRLDNLSHILAWSNKECNSLGEPAPVHLVELPRVGLTFYVTENGKKYNCVEHTGLFVSNLHDKDIHKMMRSLPHSILLQTVRGEMFVILTSFSDAGTISCEGRFDIGRFCIRSYQYFMVE